MLTITDADIILGQKANDKQQAINIVAKHMEARGLVVSGYGTGMQDREQQSSTFLGNGIAIPHGTTKTRDQVLKTGVQVIQFPEGVVWGNDDQKAYVAIGIAASSDEHIGILKQLTRILSADQLEKHLKKATDSAQMSALLNGKQGLLVFDSSLIRTEFPARTLIELKAAAVGLLSNQKVVGHAFVARIISENPVYLSDGLWLASASESVHQSAISLVTLYRPLQLDGLPVKALLVIAASDGSCTSVLSRLASLIYQQQLGEWLENDAERLLTTVLSDPEPKDAGGNVRTFVIRNSHGLHVRPSAMLVHAIKPFSSDIYIRANDEHGLVNGRVLSNITGLGLSMGDAITVIADGTDASEALDAFEEVFTSGLGEVQA